MSDEEDYSSEDDIDYVPTVGEEVSEEEGSGDEEDFLTLNEDASGKFGKRKRTAPKNKDQLVPRQRHGGIQLEGEDNDDAAPEKEENGNQSLIEQIAQEKIDKKQVQEKKKADDLWSSFLSDVKSPHVKKSSSGGLGALTSAVQSTSSSPKLSSQKQDSKSLAAKTSDKVTITKIFDFAGEEVKVTKEVAADSKEAQAELKKDEKDESDANTPEVETPSIFSKIGVKRPSPSGAGLGGLLSKIGKKTKISVLDKSKMDWDSFKKDEGIEDDLKIHNRGKESYLERMAFLNRADVRQFEKEKSVRLSNSSRR